MLPSVHGNYLGILLRCLLGFGGHFWGGGVEGSGSLRLTRFPGGADGASPGPHFGKQGFLEGLKKQSLPGPSFVPCLSSAPVACVVRIAGILITRPQPSARIPGDPGKHTLLQGHGQVTESRLPEPAAPFSSPPLPQTRD